jgi:hypothetical protein
MKALLLVMLVLMIPLSGNAQSPREVWIFPARETLTDSLCGISYGALLPPVRRLFETAGYNTSNSSAKLTAYISILTAKDSQSDINRPDGCVFFVNVQLYFDTIARAPWGASYRAPLVICNEYGETDIVRRIGPQASVESLVFAYVNRCISEERRRRIP